MNALPIMLALLTFSGTASASTPGLHTATKEGDEAFATYEAALRHCASESDAREVRTQWRLIVSGMASIYLLATGESPRTAEMNSMLRYEATKATALAALNDRPLSPQQCTGFRDGVATTTARLREAVRKLTEQLVSWDSSAGA